MEITVSKLQNFPITQILREICHFHTLRRCHYLYLWIFITFWRLKFTKSKPLKMAQNAVLDLLDSPKLISRKIWVIVKSWNFQTWQIISRVGNTDMTVSTSSPWEFDYLLTYFFAPVFILCLSFNISKHGNLILIWKLYTCDRHFDISNYIS